MRTFLILTLASIGSAAVVSAADTARATYERERAACLSGQSGQDRAACLREAAAAYQEARSARRGPALPEDRYVQNALARCQPLAADDRAECERRMRSGTSSGSVTGGGILRELHTTETAPAASADAGQPPAPAAPTAPAMPAMPAASTAPAAPAAPATPAVPTAPR
jgi:hypothetical protein